MQIYKLGGAIEADDNEKLKSPLKCYDMQFEYEIISKDTTYISI